MYMLLPAALISVALPLLLLGVFQSLSTKTLKDREKLSPFECGFDPMKSARQPFSLRFFLLAVIFLVFDVEIVLLLPIAIESGAPAVSFASIIFLIILLLGLLHEWREGSLNWSLT